MEIITSHISLAELKEMQGHYFDGMVKAVIDIQKKILAVDATLQADLEAALLEGGSCQTDLWGFNIYPDMTGDDFLEFDSLINIRPYQENRSRDIENPTVKKRIVELIAQMII